MDISDREQQILDAAADLIIRHGYDKTTMGDVADVVGISRPLVYIHFKSKDDLLEALIIREMLKYGNLWLGYIEADPQGGTVGSVYRSILNALHQTPLLAAIVTRSEGTFGKYLRRQENVFSSMQTPTLMRDLLAVMQAKGAIREDVNVDAMAYIMDGMSASMVDSSVVGDRPAPDYEVLLETMAEMLDRMLTPEGGGNLEAGKQVIREFADNARQYLSQMMSTESEAAS
jgi:AcrR family transcriptional regulator